MNSEIIELPDGTKKVAAFIAAERFATNRRAGVRNARMGGQSDEKTDLIGMLAEFAVAYRLNLWPDLSIVPRRGGHDLEYGRATIDVKATDRPNGKLLATLKTASQDHADVFVLAVVTDEEIRLVGWAYAEELLNDASILDLGHGDTYVLPQDELHSISELCAALRQINKDKA